MIPLREICLDFGVGIDTLLKYKVSLKQLDRAMDYTRCCAFVIYGSVMSFNIGFNKS